MDLRSVLRPYYHRLKKSGLLGKLPEPFEVEKALFAGKHHTDSKQPSILHFSLNKAATQYVKSILHQFARQNSLKPVGMNEWAFNSTKPYLDQLTYAEMEHYKHVFKPKGYLYSVFGGMIENIDRLEDYKILLMVRDPRDILVSSYFSTAYSHPLPGTQSDKRTNFEQKRAWAKSVNIDEYVRAEAPKLQENLLRYQNLLLTKYPHTLVVQYEEMIADFDNWLTRMLEYTGCKMTPYLRKDLTKHHNHLRPKVENTGQHIRRGRAGDFLDKLKPETIALLNDQFADVLFMYGYNPIEI